MAIKLQLRRGTAVEWSTANPTLAVAELGLELDTRKYKIGDGLTAWNSLQYVITQGGLGAGGLIGQFVKKKSLVDYDIEWAFITKSDVGLGNVENTALSTWVGSTSLTTLGTITTGTWNATSISVSNGGTGLTSIGTANQVLHVNAGATALEYKNASTTNLASSIVERDANNRVFIGAANFGAPTPAVKVDGDIYYDSTIAGLASYTTGITQFITRNLWVQTAVNTLPAATTAALSLFTGNGGAGLGTLTLPAGFWVAGRTVLIKINGHIVRTGNAGVGPEVRLGGTTINSITGAVTANIGASCSFNLECVIVAYSPTTFWVNGSFDTTNTSGAGVYTRISRIDSTGTPTIATVASPTTLDVLVTKSAANNLVIITTSAIVEVLA